MTDYLDENISQDQILLYYNRNNVSEEIDLAKSSNKKECMICSYWVFNHGFEFQDHPCNSCHDLTMLSLNISDVTIITVKNVDYLYCFS